MSQTNHHPAAENAAPLLEIKNLTKSYPGGKTAVSDLCLTVQAGDIYGFIGHNGAGKTTTLKAVAGIHGFDSGEIFVDGISLLADPLACKQRIAYIPDNPDLYSYLTGIQYLNFIADVFAVPAAQRQARIADYAGRFGLTAALGDLIASYSHGMRQKLAVIGALVHAPRLLLLDEPFVGLDPEAVVNLKEIMHDLCTQGAAIFFSTHVLDVAERLCNKVAILRGGKLVTAGRTEELTGGKPLEEVFMEVVRNAPST